MCLLCNGIQHVHDFGNTYSGNTSMKRLHFPPFVLFTNKESDLTFQRIHQKYARIPQGVPVNHAAGNIKIYLRNIP
jgi:hypothetical protein